MHFDICVALKVRDLQYRVPHQGEFVQLLEIVGVRDLPAESDGNQHQGISQYEFHEIHPMTLPERRML
jgi:hypothetical protein